MQRRRSSEKTIKPVETEKEDELEIQEVAAASLTYEEQLQNALGEVDDIGNGNDGDHGSFDYDRISASNGGGQDDDEELEEEFRYNGVDADTYEEQMKQAIGADEVEELEEKLLLDAGTPKEEGREDEIEDVRFNERNADGFSQYTPSNASNQNGAKYLSPGVASPSSSQLSYQPKRASSYLHPTVSRLRSHTRYPSNSTTYTTGTGLIHPSLVPQSHFSGLSRSQSSSTIHSVLQPPGSNFVLTPSPLLPSTSTSPLIPNQDEHEIDKEDPFRWQSLRSLSQTFFPSSSRSNSRSVTSPGYEQFGKPTVMTATGLICVGTVKGWVVVFDFRQELRCICGSDLPTRDSSPVTAVALSPDHTFVAVGHASAAIFLYDLSRPSVPARTAVPTTIKAVSLGKKEGHIEGSKILNLAFVGIRHTAIVSSDDRGMAFYHSLGRVLMVDSTDTLRLLGTYPQPSSPTATPPTKHKKPTTIFSAPPLPLSSSPHPSDVFQLIALLTPSKLVIVGLKPSPRTWFRKVRSGEGGEMGNRTGCAVWLTPSPATLTTHANLNPCLAYAWGTTLRFLHVRVVDTTASEGIPVKEGAGKEASAGYKRAEFFNGDKIQLDSPVRALHWLNANHLMVVTSVSLDIFNVKSLERIERSEVDIPLLLSQPFFSLLAPSRPDGSSTAPESVLGSVGSYKGKVFLMLKNEFRAGTLITWPDRILSLMQIGDFLGSIDLATAYLSIDPSKNTLSFPADNEERQQVVSTRLLELMQASLKFCFSEDRMTDGTNAGLDGRGVDRTSIFEGLVTSCARACLALDDLSFLLDDVYEKYSSMAIEGIYFTQLEPFVLDSSIRTIPTNIVQGMIELHDNRGEMLEAETVIWHVDPLCLDINQAITLCRKNGLWDALIYVYTRSLRDYVSPVIDLLGLMQRIHQHRIQRPQLVGEEGSNTFVNGFTDEEAEAMVPDAYKLYSFLEDALSGLTYPSEEPLPEEQASDAKSSVYSFVFSPIAASGPGATAKVYTRSDDGSSEPPYPYLTLLLQFDTEALLHALDISFEDAGLNDEDASTSRQTMVNVLLEIMTAEEFPPSDITLLHIFVSRNLPKYPQFIILPSSTLHDILVSLSTDPDQSTREDRQLAAEYLLSAYTPHDIEHIHTLFERAGFFRILRDAYKHDRSWAPLVKTYLEDPDTGLDIFSSMDEILSVASTRVRSITYPVVPAELQVTILDAIPQLVDLGVRQSALLIDRHLPGCHAKVLASLSATPHRQYGYLRCLMEPKRADADDETGPLAPLGEPSKHLERSSRHLYVSLLCQHDPSGVVQLLDDLPPDFFDLSTIAVVCEEGGVDEAVIWALDRQGQTQAAFEKASDVLRQRGADIGKGFVALSEGDPGSAHQDLQDIKAVVRMGVRLCIEHTAPGKQVKGQRQEDMWYGLLHELIELVHEVSEIIPGRHSDAGSIHSIKLISTPSFDSAPREGLDIIVLDSLRSLVQETLAALVSTASTTSLSFPNLFKQLVDDSSTESQQPGTKRVYSEFRMILKGMMNTYKSDGDMMAITIKLTREDTVGSVVELTNKQSKGWRPKHHTSTCSICGNDIHSPKQPPSSIANGKRPEGAAHEVNLTTKSGIVVYRTGEVAHSTCANLS